MPEALEVSMIASVAGTLSGSRLIRTRPDRARHHGASMVSLVGDGLKVRSGEVSLAHLGMPFLDELPEFRRSALRERWRTSPAAKGCVVFTSPRR